MWRSLLARTSTKLTTAKTMPRGKYQRQPEPVIEDKDDTLIMSIRLKSNRFESTIEIPLYSSEGERQAFIEQWLVLMQAGLQCAKQRSTSP